MLRWCFPKCGAAKLNWLFTQAHKVRLPIVSFAWMYALCEVHCHVPYTWETKLHIVRQFGWAVRMRFTAFFFLHFVRLLLILVYKLYEWHTLLCIVGVISSAWANICCQNFSWQMNEQRAEKCMHWTKARAIFIILPQFRASYARSLLLTSKQAPCHL